MPFFGGTYPKKYRAVRPSVLRVAMGDGRTDGGAESVEAHTAGRRADGRRAVEEKGEGEREVSGKTRNITAASVRITKPCLCGNHTTNQARHYKVELLTSPT